MLRRTLLLALTITSLGALPTASALAVRYASPSGGAAQSCGSVAAACDLATAIHGVAGNTPSVGEEIVVQPGTYSVPTFIQPGAWGLNIHRIEGQPRPKLVSSAGQILNGVEISLSYLELDGTTPGTLLNVSGGTLDRLLIKGDAGGQVLCQCYDGTLRDSVVVATGGLGAVGLGSNGGSAVEDYRNDTFISTAATTAAIWVQQQSSQPVSANATLALTGRNVIARNLAGGSSLAVAQQLSTQHTKLTLSHSAIGAATTALGGATIVATDAVTTAAPLFADAAAGDFRPLAGSPTIDAGIDDVLNGPLDFDGAARSVATTDIGAYEYQPPVVAPPVTVTDPSTPAPAGPTAPGVPSAETPAPGPAPIAPVVVPAAKPAAPRLTIPGRTFAAAAKTGKLSISALCTAPAGTTCTVSGMLRAAHGLSGAQHAKPLTIGTLKGSLRAGHRGTLTLTHAALVALRPPAHGKGRRLAVSLAATARAGGSAGTLAARVTVAVRRAAAR